MMKSSDAPNQIAQKLLPYQILVLFPKYLYFNFWIYSTDQKFIGPSSFVSPQVCQNFLYTPVIFLHMPHECLWIHLCFSQSIQLQIVQNPSCLFLTRGLFLVEYLVVPQVALNHPDQNSNFALGFLDYICPSNSSDYIQDWTDSSIPYRYLTYLQVSSQICPSRLVHSPTAF